jgi:ABC-type tungstate transport system substrate-binding protein
LFAFTAQELTAIALSVKVALVAALGSLPFGVACGWLLARRRFPGKSLLDALLHLPLVMPPIVTGYALLIVFGTQGQVGAWLLEHLGVQFAFRWTGAALASAVMGFPLMVRAIRLALLAHHYRSDWEWLPEDLPAAEERLARWEASLATSGPTSAADVLERLRAVLAVDLDTPGALAVLDAATTGGVDDPALLRDAIDALLGVSLG